MTGTAESSRWFGENAPCWVCAVVNGEAKTSAVLETSEVLVLVSPLSAAAKRLRAVLASV